MSTTTTKPKVMAIAPWFGSKRSMGPIIAEELGTHSAYFELCCGSMAPLFAKEPSSHETVVDMHHHLINLSRVIQDGMLGPDLYRRLQRTLCDEAIFERSKQFHKDNPIVADADMPNVECAYHFFIISWVGRNGVAGTKRYNFQMAVRWTRGGGHGGVRFQSATESLPWWHQRLRNVLILRKDIFDVIPKIDDASNVAVYVDPPYLRGGARSGSALYEHEFESGTHTRLAEALARFQKTRVVVSYYDHPRLDSLYPDWTKRDCHRQKNLHAQNRRGATGKKDAPEVLLINGPSNAAEPVSPGNGRLF